MKALSKIVLFILIALTVTFQVALSQKYDPTTRDIISNDGDELYNRAPTPLPWITEEMNTTEFWVARMENPDAIILSVENILTMNAKWLERLSQDEPFANELEDRKPVIRNWWPGFTLRQMDLSRFNQAALSDTVKSRINEQAEHMYKKPWGNALAVRYSMEDLKEFDDELAYSTIPDRISVKHGITVKPSRLRSVPSFAPMYPGIVQSTKARWDQWTTTSLNIGSPVQILHASLSGEFIFVLSNAGYFGWLRTENVAFASKTVVDEFVSESNFVMATMDRVQYYADPSCKYSSGWLGLGAKLPLASDSDPIMVKIPVRTTDGSLVVDTAWMKRDENCHIGYVPYTRRNIIEIAFKQLNDPYDWTGGWFGRQHERAYSDLFACFGFDLPKHERLYTFFNDNNTKLVVKGSEEAEYLKAISENEPFVTLQSCGGHCQLFIGNVNDKQITFDQHGYGYEDENEEWWEVRRTNIGDMRMPKYFMKSTVKFLELR